jgi:hypothetical protein
MTGRLIAIGGGCLFIVLIIYGMSFDVREWLEERLWRRDEHRAVERLRKMAAPVQDELDRFAELCGWFEAQAAEIAALPEIEPWERWVG